MPKTPPEKKLLHIGTLVPGDYFGELAILQNSKEEPLSVISDGQVEVFILSKVDFSRCILVTYAQYSMPLTV
jgi:CRP-like cAMP-binding protein